MTPDISVDIELRPEIWRIWSKRPKNLLGAMVSLHDGGLNFDFESWDALQASMLDNLLHTMDHGVVTVYDHEAASEMGGYGLRPLSQKRFYDITWLGWLPVISKRMSYLLQNRQDLQNVVGSSAWVEYSGTFLMLGGVVDDSLITRFVRQKWTEQDRFIALTLTTDYPYWIIATNYLSPNSLDTLLHDIVPKT